MTSLAETVGPLDEGGALPLYQQLQRALRKAIEIRLLAPDDALPAERDLAALGFPSGKSGMTNGS